LAGLAGLALLIAKTRRRILADFDAPLWACP
jgi:hypothetical protein